MPAPLYPDDYPSLAELRAWLKLPATVLPDEQLEVISAAEAAQQSELLFGTTVPPDLIAAWYRRCARHAAAKAIPLGVLGADAEFAAVRLARWEVEVERLEMHYTVPVIA